MKGQSHEQITRTRCWASRASIRQVRRRRRGAGEKKEGGRGVDDTSAWRHNET